MGRIIATEFVSLDGVVEAPGGDEDFEYAGWSFEIDRGEEGNKFKLDETFESDALLLGRKTYEGFAAAWPSRKGEFADKFNRMPKYVVSSTVGAPEWSNTTVLRGDLAQEVGRACDCGRPSSWGTASRSSSTKPCARRDAQMAQGAASPLTSPNPQLEHGDLNGEST